MAYVKYESSTRCRLQQHSGKPFKTLSEAFAKIEHAEQLEIAGLREQFKEIINEVKPDTAAQLCEKIRAMISFVQARIQEWNQTRTSSLQVSLGLFSFSVLGLALEANNLGKLHVYVHCLSIAFLLSLLVTSLVYFCILSKQVSFCYPFIPVAKTWRWFFLYMAPNEMPFHIFLGKKNKRRSRKLFLQGMINYSRETIKLHLEPVCELEQDLEQLYLLLIYEGYMFQFARKANDKLRWGIILSIILPVCLLVSLIVLQSYMPQIDLFQWFRRAPS